MTIHKTETFVEFYRAKASAKDVNELSGRGGRPDLLKFEISQIVSKIPVKANTVLVDIGCGEASLLLNAADNGLNSYEGRLIGILPTVEEVSRVRNHLLNNSNNSKHLISIEIGLAEKTNLPDNFADMVVCNGVLLILQDKSVVKAALEEIRRITKKNALIYLGEMPDTDESAGKNYGNSITRWLIWVLRNQGFQSFWTRLKQTIPALFGSEPFVIAPKNYFYNFYMPPLNFIELLN
jgi:SAM-dependent methyltransferase